MAFLGFIVGNGKGNGNRNSPDYYETQITSDIFNKIFSPTFDRIGGIVSDISNALGEDAVEISDDSTGKKIKPTDGYFKRDHEKDFCTAFEREYYSATEKIAKVLAVIRSEVPDKEHSSFREYYSNLLKEFLLGEYDANFFENELSIYKNAPAEIKNRESAVKSLEETCKDERVHKDNRESYEKQLAKKKMELDVLKVLYDRSKSDIVHFPAYHFNTPHFITHLFDKIAEVYKKEGIEGAMDFTEALYLPLQGKGNVPNPVKRAYANEVISLLEKGKAAEQINEFACSVNGIIEQIYNSYPLNIVILKRAVELAMDTGRSTITISAETKAEGEQKC